MSPILTVLVRHMVNKRKHSYRRMLDSIHPMISCHAVQLLTIKDELESGHPYVTQMMIARGDEIKGDYVWLLDDDDVGTCCNLHTLVKRVSERHDPDLIICRSLIANRGLMPCDKLWGKPLKNYPEVSMPMPSMIVKTRLWRKCIPACALLPKRVDWHLFCEIRNHNPKVYYLNALTAWQHTKNSTRGEGGISDDDKAVLYGNAF